MQKSMYRIPDTALFLDRSVREYPLMFRDLPPEGKPREKLLAQGPEGLSVKELAALLLVTGTVKEDVLEMASRIVTDYGEKNIFAERNAEKLSKELDIPLVKACTIVAAGELYRRLYDRGDIGFTTIRNAQDAYNYLSDMKNLPREQLRGLYLNSHNKIIRDEVISMGTVNANIVHAREIFRIAIECNAVAIVLAHNHPSGEVTPSAEDIDVTKQIIQAGKIVGIRVLDHVIITKDTFQSVNADY
jgi:DNA repair protein RadC